MIIYLSGAISSRLDTYQDHFKKVQDKLIAHEQIVLSPHVLPIGLTRYSDYMHIAEAMIDVADAICMLEGWEKSPGANWELQHARFKKIIVLYEKELDQID